MSRVITFSRVFPSYHPRVGESTYFVEGIWKSIGSPHSYISDQYTDGLEVELARFLCGGITPKHHTIRVGDRWKVGDKFSPRVWSGIPYNSKQIIIDPDIEIKKVWDFEMKFGIDRRHKMPYQQCIVNNKPISAEIIAANDGLELGDLLTWFNKPFRGQIICWNDNVNY